MLYEAKTFVPMSHSLLAQEVVLGQEQFAAD